MINFSRRSKCVLRTTAIALLIPLCTTTLLAETASAGFRGNISRSSINRSSINRSSINRSFGPATSRTGITTLQGSSIDRSNINRADINLSDWDMPRTLELEDYPDLGDRQDQRIEVREDWQDQRTDTIDDRQDYWSDQSSDRQDNWEDRADDRQDYWEDQTDDRQDYWEDRVDDRQDYWEDLDDDWYYGWNGDWWYGDDYWDRYYPPGFWLASIGTTAILIDAADDIYYDSGVYYEYYDDGYTVVAAPVGASVTSLPDGFVTTPVGNQIYYYYLGTFYILDSTTRQYVVVTPPAGAVVPYLPEGYTTLVQDGTEYYQFADTYYRPYYVNDQLVFVVTYL